MIRKHISCNDPGCKDCSERMSDKIIREESAKFYPGRGEMTEKEKSMFQEAKTAHNFYGVQFRPRKIEPSDYNDIKFEPKTYKTVDDLRTEESKKYTRADMIRSFVQGYKCGFDASDGVFAYDAHEAEDAKDIAVAYLNGKLGKEGD